MGVLGIWEVGKGGGGPLFPKVNVKILANLNFLVKTKNVPKGLKCKKIIFFILGVPKARGGVCHLEKNPK